MAERKQKSFTIAIFLFIVFACTTIFAYGIFDIEKIHATEPSSPKLEIQYPTIYGQTLTQDSKLPDFALYLFNAGVFIGFLIVLLSLIISGTLYFVSPFSAEAKASAKDRISGAISGLLVLVLTYLIITTINPQLGIFRVSEPPASPPQEEEKKLSGVYFYTAQAGTCEEISSRSDAEPGNGCSDPCVYPKTSDISDLGNLKNIIESIGIIQDPENQIYYLPILYSNPGLWGKCQWLDPNEECHTGQGDKSLGWVESASIHMYDPSPNGDGVYFFRKSCLTNQPSVSTSDLVAHCKENSGGYLKVSNDKIKPSGGSFYVKDLNKLKFGGDSENGACTVPEEEQDCADYDINGKCIRKSCPTLGGENISSMIIKGDYLVILFYFGFKDEPKGPWSFCQEFPTPEDENDLGPRQIKWEHIRNSSIIIEKDNANNPNQPLSSSVLGVVPNYILIIPIQKQIPGQGS